MQEASIPVVRLGSLAGDRRDPHAVEQLGRAFESLGFVAISEHGVPESLLNEAYAAARAVFDLPLAEKQTCEDPNNGRQRGYTSIGIEHAKDHPEPDLKEFWHIGRSLPSLPKNRYPTQITRFGPTSERLFTELDRVATAVLAGIGAYLEKPPGFFDALTRGGNSVLRVIHYPPLPAQCPTGSVRAAAHEDINLITVLPVATQPGLQLRTSDGVWVDIQTPPGVMICDTGDMMQLLTGGRLRSTTHRVVGPLDSDNRSRYSMPFFCHPHGDAILRDHPVIRAHDFLMERLRAIGVA